MDIKERAEKGLEAALGDDGGIGGDFGAIVIVTDNKKEESHSRVNGPAGLTVAAMETLLATFYAKGFPPGVPFLASLVPILLAEIDQGKDRGEPMQGPGKAGES